MSLFLVGYMGTGKSSVGKRLANRLDMEFVDMDVLIEEYANAKIPEIFERSGEETFRMLEDRILEKLLEGGPKVIATGGGTPCHSDNMSKIKSKGFSVYLDLPAYKIARRVRQSKQIRPLLNGKEGDELVKFISNHLSERIPAYEQANLKFNADKINSAVLDKIKENYLAWSQTK